MQIREEVRLSGTSWRRHSSARCRRPSQFRISTPVSVSSVMVLLECCATVHEAWCDAKPQVSTGDVAQLAERLLCKSLDSCAVLTCHNAGSRAPRTS